MSIYPSSHPSVEPVSRVESGSAVWWTYNPDAPLGEGRGIMWDHAEGWVLWRDQPSGTGDRFIEKMPETDVPNWANDVLKTQMREKPMLEINGVAWPRFIKKTFNPDVDGENEDAIREELLRMRDLINEVEPGGEEISGI